MTGEAAPEGDTPDALLRQLIAGTGKELPDGLPGETAEDTEDADAAEADPSFAWFAMPAVLTESAPIFVKPLPGAQPILLPETQVTLPAVIADPAGLPADPAASAAAGPVVQADPAFATLAAPIEAPAAAAPALPTEVSVGTAPDSAPDSAPATGITRPATPPREAQPTHMARARVQAPTPIPLAMLEPSVARSQPLAVALASAGIELPEQFRRPAPRDPLSALTAPTAAAPDSFRPNTVQAVVDAQQPALDLQTRQAMNAMIDRIEAMRDSSGPRDTSIRLSPDALGTVDVSIRHEGDRIHVRFVAENAAARALLADAQPRLLEIAEARGLKLGQTQIAGGDAGQSGQRQHAAPAAPAPAPAPASARSPEPTESTTDDRIA